MRDIIPEHHIQKRLFNRLVGSKVMRYSELKPKELEANLFMYHLKELMKMGLVEKSGQGYQLSAQGRSTATRFSIREQGIRVMPSSISVISLKNGDNWLLYKRKRQPYIDSLGFPSGKIHLGDKLVDAAYRELDEKCGYKRSEINLLYRGVFNLVEFEDNELKNHIIGHVWEGQLDKIDQRIFANHAGETFWGDWKDYPYEQFIPGLKEIIDALEKPEFFGLDLYFNNSN